MRNDEVESFLKIHIVTCSFAIKTKVVSNFEKSYHTFQRMFIVLLSYFALLLSIFYQLFLPIILSFFYERKILTICKTMCVHINFEFTNIRPPLT